MSRADWMERMPLPGAEVPTAVGVVMRDRENPDSTVVVVEVRSNAVNTIDTAEPFRVEYQKLRWLMIDLESDSGMAHALRLLAAEMPGAENVADAAWAWLWDGNTAEARIIVATLLSEVFE